MALQINYDSEQLQISFPESYQKVESFHADKETETFVLAIYPSLVAYQNGSTTVDKRMFNKPADIEAGVSLTSLYDYLKTLPEFAGAIDV